MPVSKNPIANTKQSYVPPSLRNKNKSFVPSTKKTEPKKEFPQAEAFPTLGETIKQTANAQVALTAWNQATHIYFNHLTTTYNIVAFESKLHLPE